MKSVGEAEGGAALDWDMVVHLISAGGRARPAAVLTPIIA